MTAGLPDRLGGLPGPLPPGEAIVWQGAPAWRPLLASLFHARLVGIYFLVLAAAGLLAGSPVGAAVTLAAGLGAIGVLALLARAYAATTVYTLTERRLVLKTGIALPMSFNLPLARIEAADLRLLARGHGDIALNLAGTERIGWALLWPHVRPRRMRRPQPMLRALPQAREVAMTLYQLCAAQVREGDAALRPAPAPAAEPAAAREPAAGQPVGAFA